MMRAVGFTEFGGPDVLRLVSLPVPAPGPDQVRVRVAAAARMRQVLPGGVDALLDAAVMGPPVLAAVRDGGRVIAVRPHPGETERGIAVSLVLVFRHLHEGGTLTRLAELAAKGVLSPRVADVLPAARAAEAHRRFEARGVRGRLVLAL